MKNKIYKIKKLLEGLEMVSSDFQVYMHKTSEEFIVLGDEDIRTYESHILDQDSSLLDWKKDMILLIEDIFYKKLNDYFLLPTSRDIHEHKIMEQFSYTLEQHLKDIFLSAIFRKGAFNNFHKLLIQYDLRKSWFEFKRNAYIDILINWCENLGLNYEV